MSQLFTPEQFIQLVQQMRTCQKQYFEARRKDVAATAASLLRLSKDLESKVDRALLQMQEESVNENQGRLF